MALFTLGLINAGCEERFDNPRVNPTDGKTVEVSMAIGFADESDACNLFASTKANVKERGTFDVELVPTAVTRAGAVVSIKPDQLYKLEIRQYKQNGDCYAGSGQAPADWGIGERLSVTLTEDADCQLVFVAWGKENSAYSLGTGTLSAAENVSIPATYFENIQPDDMSKMPYVLHLKHVNVASDGKITSPAGEDVRILLKRLATRLNISWDYKVSGYDLKQIILQSIPRNYKVVSAPDEDNTYPSLMDQYADIQLTDAQINGVDKSYSCWVPANVRGFNTASNAPQYRIKSNAPTGSSYASFIAVNSTDNKKKLNYRIYLGGKDYSDFNLNENTDYSYKINFNHTSLPVDDKRVTIIDPIPASENNKNFVPTANCFMVAPGGAFCFDPFTYQQNGVPITNTLLNKWSTDEDGITSVKLLWQTKENGDIGDPVMGVVNSSDDHTNIVDLKDGLIYCRVAPNTSGGSGLIAAYNNKEEILWSWFIWVTDYNPDSRGNEDIQLPDNKRKQKYQRSDLPDQLPMMDRNLGAVAGYTTIPSNPLEISKTNGFHFQWGRKDPFRSSYTKENNVEKITIPVPNTAPVKNLLSLYQPDGVSYYPIKVVTEKVSYRTAYANPDILYKIEGGESQWNNGDADHAKAWGETKNKGLHDPCPVGWYVCSNDNYKPFFTNTDYDALNLVSGNTPATQGGYLIIYNRMNNRTTYMRVTGYWIGANSFTDIGRLGYYWPREKGKMLRFIVGTETSLRGSEYVKEAMPVRCIQERE